MSLLHYDMPLEDLVAEYINSYNEMIDLIDEADNVTSEESRIPLQFMIEEHMETNAHIRTHILVRVCRAFGYELDESARYIHKL